MTHFIIREFYENRGFLPLNEVISCQLYNLKTVKLCLTYFTFNAMGNYVLTQIFFLIFRKSVPILA
jgi:hypothetical protein